MNLTHHFLIAMPGLDDEVFQRSVVYLCEHSERGALGLVINKPADMSLQSLFSKVDLPLARVDLRDAPVLQGGPVQTERGFVLHEAVRAVGWSDPASEDGDGPADAGADLTQASDGDPTAPGLAASGAVYASTLSIPGGLEMTTSKDVLEALSSGGGPRKVVITLGYSAWAQGQLESELGENAWLTVAADPDVIFGTPPEQRYDRALALLGLQSWMLSPDVGHG